MTITPTPRKSGASFLTTNGAFILLIPVLIIQVGDEWGQVAITLLAAGGLGVYVGHARSGRSPATYLVHGAILGFLLWLTMVVIAGVFYPSGDGNPGAWFVRFGLGSALVIAATAMLGDQAARGKSTPSIATLASVIGIAGGLLTIIRGG